MDKSEMVDRIRNMAAQMYYEDVEFFHNMMQRYLEKTLWRNSND